MKKIKFVEEEIPSETIENRAKVLQNYDSFLTFSVAKKCVLPVDWFLMAKIV